MPRSDFVRRHEAAFRDFHIFLVGALPLRLIPKEDSSSLMFLLTGQVTEIGRPKYLIHGR